MYIYIIISFTLGLTGAWLITRFGFKFGLNDTPNHRSSHKRIVPKGGGIGVLASFIFASLVFDISFGFWLPALVISIISFFGGDKHRLSPKERLIVQFCCSFSFLAFFFLQRGGGGSILLSMIPAAVFIVGTSNFYNFMDGIDGIAGITAVVGFLLIALYSYLSSGEMTYLPLSICLAAACVGFLFLNLPKAKVFLGDVGSVLIGYLFACLILTLSHSFVDFMVMTGCLITIYCDELFTMYMRVRDGESLIRAHRRHIYQILVNEFAVCHWKISSLYGGIQLIAGLTFIFAGLKGAVYLLFLFCFYILIFLIAALKINKRAMRKCR